MAKEDLSIQADSSLWTEIVDTLKWYANPDNHLLQRNPCRCGKRCNDIHPMEEDRGAKAQELLDILKAEGLVEGLPQA